MGKIIRFIKGADRPLQFEVMLKPHIETLYKLAWRFTANRVDAEDLVQGFLLKLYTKMTKLEEVDDLKPWLSRSFYNFFVSEYRKAKRDPLRNAEEVEQQELPVSDVDPYRQQERRNTGENVMALVQQLPPEQRTIIVMHDMEGYALHEIAEISQVPLGTVKSRLCRAREKLKKMLQTEPWNALLRDVR